MTINHEYLKAMSREELLDALTHRRRMRRVYERAGASERAWADHHAEVIAAIEREFARRAREGVAP